jgi:hypothetical protein
VKVVVKRTVCFALAVSLVYLGLNVIFTEIPKLALSLVAVLLVSLCALFGGLIGFYFLPSGRKFHVHELALIGASFGVLAFCIDRPLATRGLAWFLVGLAVAAVAIVQAVGRLLARRNP